MDYKLDGRDILYNDDQLGPYPDHLLKRVDVPTNAIPGKEPRRKGQRENAFATIRTKKDMTPAMQAALKRGKREPLTLSLMEVRNGFKGISANPNPVAEKKAPIPDDPRVRSRHLKSLGYFLGADMMGICEVPDYAYYLQDPAGNPIDCEYKYAIILVKRKDGRTTLASAGNDWIFDPCSHSTYNVLFHWAETMANYLRQLGFDARASNFGNYTTVMTSLLIAAGIGESGRIGIAVNPFFGSNFKAAAVLTNMELEADKPIDFGLQEFCKTCGICAQTCVSGAISKDNEQIEYNGYRKYKIDYERCATLCNVNQKGGICGRCSNMCPWNRPDSDPEFFKDWDGDISRLQDAARARAEYLRQNNFESEEYKTRRWWFDLMVDESGELVIPPTTKYSK